MPVREFQRSARSTRSSEIIAAQQVNVADPNQFLKLKAVNVISRARTNRCWDWYDRIGEVRYAVNRTARTAGHAVIGAYQREGIELGKKLTSDPKITAITAGIWSPSGGQRGLIETFYKLMKMHAQAHLIRLPKNADGSSGGYEFISDEEFDADGDRIWRITLPISSMAGFSETDLKKATRVEIKPEDYLGRVWQPHPKHSDMPDSPMHALDSICEELYLLQQGVKAKLISRLMSNGVWYIPSEISDVVKTYSENADNPGPKYSTDSVLNAIITTLAAGRMSYDDAAAAFPILVRGPGEQADNLQFKYPDIQIVEVDIKLRAEALDRILQGLDCKPESVKGNGDSNHWSSWSTRDEDLKENVIPDLEMLCWTLEQLILIPEAEAADADVDNVGLWFDLSDATTRPNVGEDARQGNENGTVSDRGFRALAGIDEEFAPSEEEMVRHLGKKNGVAYLATFGLKIADRIDWDKVGKTKDSTSGPDPEPEDGKVSPARPGADGTTGKNDSSKRRTQQPAA